MTNIINWSGYSWETRQRWGRVHKDYPHTWYDPAATEISDDKLILKTHYNPKYFNKTGEIAQIGVGLVSNTERFGYGRFEITARLPTGKALWPAFWMWSWSDWPPEIDVFEGYTKDSGYFNLSLDNPSLWNVKTNAYYDLIGSYVDTTTSIEAKTHWMWKNPAKHFITYAVEWLPNIILFEYDGRVVRKIKRDWVLEFFKGHKMNVIINNMFRTNKIGYLNKANIPRSSFVIKDFTYYKY